MSQTLTGEKQEKVLMVSCLLVEPDPGSTGGGRGH